MGHLRGHGECERQLACVHVKGVPKDEGAKGFDLQLFVKVIKDSYFSFHSLNTSSHFVRSPSLLIPYLSVHSLSPPITSPSLFLPSVERLDGVRWGGGAVTYNLQDRNTSNGAFLVDAATGEMRILRPLA